MLAIARPWIIAVALSLPMVAACVDDNDSSAGADIQWTGPAGPDPSKPTIDPQLKSVNWMVDAKFVGPLTATANTIPVGGKVSLSINANMNMVYTPYYILIFELQPRVVDAGPQKLMAACGTGSTCSTGLFVPASTPYAKYAAYIAPYTTVAPPPQAVAASPKTYVVTSARGYSLSLPTGLVCSGGANQITATANIDVGTTPYWIQIGDDAGRQWGACKTGRTCTAPYPCGIGITAFIATQDTHVPPTFPEAASNTVLPDPPPEEE
jgi:hypothetical protein